MTYNTYKYIIYSSNVGKTFLILAKYLSMSMNNEKNDEKTMVKIKKNILLTLKSDFYKNNYLNLFKVVE